MLWRGLPSQAETYGFSIKGSKLAGGSKRTIWLFKSAYYPELRRRILSILSLPKGCPYQTDYDSKWVDDAVKSHLRGGGMLDGATVYFAFIDYASTPPKFYPIRSCKIIRIDPQEPYVITLQMGNFLTFKEHENENRFNQSLSDWLNKKNYTETSDSKITVKKLFMFSDDTSTTSSVEEVEDTGDQAWRRIVDYLVQTKPIGPTHQFDRSLFLRFAIIDGESLTQLSVHDTHFTLQPNRGYVLKLRVYQPHFANFTDKETAIMNFAFDEEYIRHVGPRRLRLPLAKRTYTEDFSISVNPLMWGAKSHIAFERYSEEYDGPSCQVPFEVPKRSEWIVFRFLPFSLGLVLMVLPELIRGWFNLPITPTETTILTLLGVLFSSISLYRLQSG